MPNPVKAKRESKRKQIEEYFVEFAVPPINQFSHGWKKSFDLHMMFGQAFRSRVSEINRDPESPITIENYTRAGGNGTEYSYYRGVMKP